MRVVIRAARMTTSHPAGCLEVLRARSNRVRALLAVAAGGEAAGRAGAEDGRAAVGKSQGG